MNYYPGYAFFRDRVDLVAVLSGLASGINTSYKLILELSGQREPFVYATLAEAGLARQDARLDVKGFTLLAPLQQIDVHPTPGGYLAFDFRGFDEEWYEERDPTPDNLRAKRQYALEFVTALVEDAGAIVAYISSAHDHYAGPVTPDAQSAEVWLALEARNSDALARALWGGDSPLPWLIAVDPSDSLLKSIGPTWRSELQETHGDGVRLIEDVQLNPWKVSAA